jgi:hypothetical protein
MPMGAIFNGLTTIKVDGIRNIRVDGITDADGCNFQWFDDHKG